jgi:hypothetical protein
MCHPSKAPGEREREFEDLATFAACFDAKKKHREISRSALVSLLSGPDYGPEVSKLTYFTGEIRLFRVPTG